MKKCLSLPFIGLILMLLNTSAYAQNRHQIDSTSRDFDFIKDDFIVAALDSLANLRYFEGFECATSDELENVFGFSNGFVPVYSDSVYAERMRRLDATTPIKLTYNQYVKDYIELYAVKKRLLTQRVMGLAQIYFPMFEEQLDRFNMPLELKYLAIVESALNPEARSRVGATGLWQFMYGTGKMYDLKVSSFVDDRRDPIKSTIAACEHMNDLYKMYNDWLLVLAAYNSGAGNVNKAIRRSGGKMDFWQIRPFLPLETRGYVPAFIGVTYVMTYAAEHNLKPVSPRIQHYEIDTVTVKDILTFQQISEYMQIPVEDLQFLNPSFKSGVIPAVDGKPYTLRLPKKYVPSFVNNEAQLYALLSQKETEKQELLTMMKTVTQAEYHKVKRGESLGRIASKYHCSISDLKRWNKIKGTTIQIGQRLIVRPETTIEQPVYYAKKSEPKAEPENLASKSSQAKETVEKSDSKSEDIASADTSNQPKTVIQTENITHKVKKGESLNLIAKEHKVQISDIQEWNKLKGTTIHPNQVLVVGKKEIITPVSEEELAAKTPAKQNKSDFIYYTVQQGDTLWTIAQKHNGVSVEELKKLNNIINEKSLKPGQKIKVAVAS
jgi:membrane-bound lytic murein transglycosylase D